VAKFIHKTCLTKAVKVDFPPLVPKAYKKR